MTYKPHRDIRKSKRVGDPSSKYGLPNPKQDAEDIERAKKAQEAKTAIRDAIYNTVYHSVFLPADGIQVVLDVVREIYQEVTDGR